MMYRYFTLVVFLFSSAFGGGIDFSLEYSFDDIEFSLHRDYLRLELPGCHSLGKPGEPLLPVQSVVLAVPASALNVTVSLESSSIRILNSKATIQPCAVPRPFSAAGAVPEIIEPDIGIYGTDALWPSSRISNVRTGSKAGFMLLSFQVSPVRYNPVSGELEIAERIIAHVSWSEGAGVFRTPGQIERSRRQLESWIDNPEYLASCSPALSSAEGAVDLIVITSDDYSDSFTQLVNYKNATGFTTELVDIASILSGGSGWDDAEILRNYIIERYQNDGLQHVLLGGDETVIPVRMINLYCEGYSDCVPVDLYYSDLDGTWDASGDHDYGQPDDALDLYSDVTVGRALIGSQADAALFVERTLEYQQNPPAGDWQSTAMLCGAGLFTGYTGAKVCDSIAVNLPMDWTIHKAYETAKSSDGFTTPVDIINDGTNWVHYAGHGNTTGIYWQDYPSDMMTNSIASGLTNGSKAGVHHSIACMPGAFHDGSCCAEALWHNPDGGAASVLFNTSYGWEGDIPEMGVSEWMCVYLTEEVFQLSNTLIGEAFSTAKDRRVPLWSGGFDRELYCILDWHAFHDPTMTVLDGLTGIDESSGSVPFLNPADIGDLRPNPATASITFTTNFSSSQAYIEIFDLSGRVVWSTTTTEPGPVHWNFNSSREIDISSGIYFAVIRSGGFSDSVRFVITR